MARRKKKLEVFEYRGLKVDIFLDHETGTFSAELPFDTLSQDEVNSNRTYGGSDHYSDGSLVALREKLGTAIGIRLNAKFKPAIYVQPLEDCGRLSLEYYRIFEAPKPGGGLLLRQFIPKGAVQEGFLPDEVDGSPGAYCYRNTDVTRLDYSPEKWTALRKLSKMLEQLRDKINEEIADASRLDKMLLNVQKNAAFNIGFTRGKP